MVFVNDDRRDVESTTFRKPVFLQLSYFLQQTSSVTCKTYIADVTSIKIFRVGLPVVGDLLTMKKKVFLRLDLLS